MADKYNYFMVDDIPFLCVITPIFDGALEALKLLIEALKKQTMKDFVHVMISAGPSENIHKLVKSFSDPRFVYDEYAALKTEGREDLIASLGERRTYGIKKYKAHRYVLLDADLKIISDDYFLELHRHHHDATILLTKIWKWGSVKTGPPTVLPKYPLTRGRIDLANISFSREIADNPKCVYPSDMGLYGGRDGDWRFFENIHNPSYKPLSIVSAIYNGNSTYQSVSSKMDKTPNGI